MTIKHQIILNYIKDLSVETPDVESVIAARENFSKHNIFVSALIGKGIDDLKSRIVENIVS